MKLVNDDRDDNADEDVNTSQVTETVQPAITNLPFSLPLTPRYVVMTQGKGITESYIKKLSNNIGNI